MFFVKVRCVPQTRWKSLVRRLLRRLYLPHHPTRALRSSCLDLAATPTPYGPLVQKVDVQLHSGTYSWSVAHPGALIWYLCCSSDSFCRLVSRTLARVPNSHGDPWQIAFYSDEVTPANNLKPDQRLRTNCMYWTILDFGAEALSHTDLWFVLAYFQSDHLADVPSGIANLCATAFKVYRGVQCRMMRESSR